MKKTLKKTALTQTTEEYASRSSIHGIGYVFDRELNIVDRLLWLVIVLAFLGIAAALSGNFWSQWRNEQVIKTNCFTFVCLVYISSFLYQWPKIQSQTALYIFVPYVIFAVTCPLF